MNNFNRKELGSWGEKKAVKYLQRQDYKILEKNFYTRTGEIDIITSKNDWIVFIEVKTRLNQKFGIPAAAVDNNKQKKIKNTAQIFLKSKKIKNKNIRFDVITISVNTGEITINHIPHAFY